MFKTDFGNSAMEKTALYKWHSKFDQGDNYVTCELRPGRPSSMSTKNSDRWMTI